MTVSRSLEHLVQKMTNRQDLANHLVHDHNWHEIYRSFPELLSAPDLLAIHKGLHEADDFHTGPRGEEA